MTSSEDEDVSGDGWKSTDTQDLLTLKSWKIMTKKNTFSYFGSDIESVWNGSYFFVQGADIQFGFIQRYLEHNAVPGWEREIQLAEKIVEKVNRMAPKPRFFVICGDLCDAISNEEPEIYRKQVVAFKTVFQKLDPSIPLVCVCGNHDIGDHPTPFTINVYRQAFGDDYYSFWCGGVFFIVINSQYYCDVTEVQEQATKYYNWLDKQLEEIQKTTPKHVVVFQHTPWFTENIDERELRQYFTLDVEIRKSMLDRFIEAGVRYIFCGHCHRNCGGVYRNLEVVVTSAMGGQLGPDASGLRVVKVTEDNIHHKYYAVEHIPVDADINR